MAARRVRTVILGAGLAGGVAVTAWPGLDLTAGRAAMLVFFGCAAGLAAPWLRERARECRADRDARRAAAAQNAREAAVLAAMLADAIRQAAENAAGIAENRQRIEAWTQAWRDIGEVIGVPLPPESRRLRVAGGTGGADVRVLPGRRDRGHPGR